jgi:hypothetical protein
LTHNIIPADFSVANLLDQKQPQPNTMQFSTLALFSMLALASAATASNENQHGNKQLRRRQLFVKDQKVLLKVNLTAKYLDVMIQFNLTYHLASAYFTGALARCRCRIHL